MSTILKALRRLEEDRSLEQVDNLRERVAGGVAAQPKPVSRLQVVAIVAGGLASALAGGLAFAYWSATAVVTPPVAAAQPRPAALIATPTAGDVAPARAVDPARNAFATPSPQPTTARPLTPRAGSPGAEWLEIEEVPSGAIFVAMGDPTPDHEAFASDTPSEIASVLDSERLLDLEPEPYLEPEAPAPVEFASDIAVVMPAEAVLARGGDRDTGAVRPLSPLARLVEEPLPVIRRAAVPRIEVVKTVWHPQPARREAVVRISGGDELVRLAEGDAVGTLVLLEIQPAGVIFSHGGVQIQRRVGGRSGF